MKKFWCFVGVHEYVVQRQGPLTRRLLDGGAEQLHFYDLRCACCGKMRTYNL